MSKYVAPVDEGDIDQYATNAGESASAEEDGPQKKARNRAATAAARSLEPRVVDDKQWMVCKGGCGRCEQRSVVCAECFDTGDGAAPDSSAAARQRVEMPTPMQVALGASGVPVAGPSGAAFGTAPGYRGQVLALHAHRVKDQPEWQRRVSTAVMHIGRVVNNLQMVQREAQRPTLIQTASMFVECYYFGVWVHEATHGEFEKGEKGEPVWKPARCAQSTPVPYLSVAYASVYAALVAHEVGVALNDDEVAQQFEEAETRAGAMCAKPKRASGAGDADAMEVDDGADDEEGAVTSQLSRIAGLAHVGDDEVEPPSAQGEIEQLRSERPAAADLARRVAGAIVARCADADGVGSAVEGLTLPPGDTAHADAVARLVAWELNREQAEGSLGVAVMNLQKVLAHLGGPPPARGARRGAALWPKMKDEMDRLERGMHDADALHCTGPCLYQCGRKGKLVDKTVTVQCDGQGKCKSPHPDLAKARYALMAKPRAVLDIFSWARKQIALRQSEEQPMATYRSLVMSPNLPLTQLGEDAAMDVAPPPPERLDAVARFDAQRAELAFPRGPIQGSKHARAVEARQLRSEADSGSSQAAREARKRLSLAPPTYLRDGKSEASSSLDEVEAMLIWLKTLCELLTPGDKATAEAAALASLCRFFDKADAKLIHKINGLELKNAPDDHGVVAAMALVDVSVRAVGDASLQWCDARALHAPRLPGQRDVDPDKYDFAEKNGRVSSAGLRLTQTRKPVLLDLYVPTIGKITFLESGTKGESARLVEHHVTGLAAACEEAALSGAGGA